MSTWNNDTVRQLERRSIRAFMEAHRGHLVGRVLDFGAGRQPYRDLVSGEYVPYEFGDAWPEGAFDAVMCNQVVQYLPNVAATLRLFRSVCRGALVMTYPTNWDEVETTDLWRFTKTGMERLLVAADFAIVTHERRAEIDLNGFKFPLGYGVVAV